MVIDKAADAPDPINAPESDKNDIVKAVQDLQLSKEHDAYAASVAAATCPADKAVLIRKQVDYYFSDANLQTDSFLKRKMKSSKNKPFPLSHIAGFKKMQPFLPIEHIYDALLTSETVNVFVDNQAERCIQRKEVFHSQPSQASAAGPVRKKAKNASGYEPFFADAPTTPAVAREEEELYSPENHITERIETAVHRYQTRRKMDSFTRNVFTKWMAFGGISLGPSPFQGGPTPEELEDMTAKEKKDATRHVYVVASESDDYGDPLWEVDFVSLAKAWLSRRAPDVLDLSSNVDTERTVNIMLNFYRYLQQHDVCPEYNEDIQIAKGFCEQALVELPKVNALYAGLPGTFNMAASTLFEGQFSGLSIKGMKWTEGLGEDDGSEWTHSNASFGMPDKDAQLYFVVSLVAMGLDKHRAEGDNFKIGESHKRRVVRTWPNLGLEVEKVVQPTPAMRREFELHARLLPRETTDKKACPLGMLVCKEYAVPTFAADDLPPGVSRTGTRPGDRFHILLEEDLLQHCYPGLKIQGTVHQLDTNMQFLDGIVGIWPSFDTLLCNDLVMGYREVHWYTDEELAARDGDAEEQSKDEDSEDVPDSD